MQGEEFKNMAQARRKYSELVQRDNTDYLNWSEWILFERWIAADNSQARQLYKRVSQLAGLADPQRVWGDWLQFERECGDADQYTAAVAQCQTHEREWYARAEKAQAQAEAQAQAQQHAKADRAPKVNTFPA